MKKSNQGETRQHNSRLILRTIYQNGEISRVDVSRSTALTRTTVSEIVAEFMAEGLVLESGLSPSTGGKPAILLRVDENARLMLAIDLAESEFRGGLVNLRGEIRHRKTLPVADLDGDAALDLVFTLVQELLAAADRPVLGIGIGTPGLMDPSGMVSQAINLNWQNLPLGELLFQKFGLPVYIANDCQVAALSEFTFGDAGSGDSLLLIKAGRGIGAGIIVGGKLIYGDNAGAGEIGHIQVLQNGETCRCGNRGCLETIVSENALVAQARRVIQEHPGTALFQRGSRPDDLSIETLLLAYQNKDPWVAALVREAAGILGSVAAHLVGALNINQIKIAGSLSRFGDALVEPVREKVQNGTLKALARHTEVGISSLGDDIVILGAASLIMKNELGLS